MEKTKRFLRAVLTVPVTIAMMTVNVIAAPAFNAPVNEANALALLKEYDPEGYYVVNFEKQNNYSNIPFWLSGTNSNADGLDVTVHEEYHGYTIHKNGYFRDTENGYDRIETIRLTDGREIIVPFLSPDGTMYATKSFTKTLPESMRTDRYNTYVSEGSENSSNVDGIYGLLNEYSAYSWGFSNQMHLYPYYKANNTFYDFFNNCINDYQAYEEFRYWTLGLLNYEQKNAPKHYVAHMNNIDWINAYCGTTMQARDMIKQFTEYCSVMSDSQTWASYSYRLTSEKESRGINMLEEASAQPELKAIEDELFASSTIIVTEEQLKLMTEFVTRLYKLCLDREPDDGGLKYWVGLLKTRQRTASQVVTGFFFSKEMNQLNLSNDEYLERCYKVMMNRSADAGGKKYWLERLTNGITKMFVIHGFVESKEFTAIASKYGIIRGTVTLSDVRDQNYGITSFVARCYTKALGRSFDENGLKTWVGKILNAANKKAAAISTASSGFLHSREFQNKNLSDEEYVQVLYRVFLDREYDEAGLRDWTGHLANGMSRDEVMKGFANSAEFALIMARYGIK